MFHKTMYFSNDQVPFFNDFSHVELILLVLFSLFWQISIVKTEVSEHCGIDVDFPSLVSDLYSEKNGT